MNEINHNDILLKAGIKITAIRLLVLKAMCTFNRAFSLGDLEAYLETVDKSTLFRTLNLFLEHHLIHSIDDGSGSIKYCLCIKEGECTIQELHCHFYCESCKNTFCLDEAAVPVVSAPEGFVLQKINYVMKGLCPACATKRK
ncbi:MAG: Fur family transcriptional regulator [Bacteroidales bacterium]